MSDKPMTAIQALSSLPPATKEAQKQYAAKLKDEILSGNFNPLNAHIFLKAITDTITEVLKDDQVKEYVLDEARKHNEKTFEFGGAKITVANKPTYDYSSCGDPIYNSMLNDLERLKEQMKAREATLKTGVDPATGETFNPVKVTNSEYLTIKIQ